MKLVYQAAIWLAIVMTLSGCKGQRNDSDGIRAGVVEHLTSLKTLNVSAMEIDIKSVNIQGDQAQALVEFLPKSGAPAGAGMQVSYALEKENGSWSVKKTLGTGGVIEHPAAGANPHMQPGQTGASDITAAPMYQDLLHREAGKATGPLAPRHPQVDPNSANLPKTEGRH